MRCKSHSLPGDVCVRGNACEDASCTKQAVFAAEGSVRGMRCKTHSLPDDVNVVSAKCRHQGCYKRAHYGTFSLPPTYCSEHRDHSLHIHEPRKRCSYWDDSGKCREYASHAPYGRSNKRIYCGTHATPEMVDYSGYCHDGLLTPDETDEER